MRTLCLTAVCILVLAGCKSNPPEKPATPPPSKTMTPTVQQPESALRWTPAREDPVDLLGRPKVPATPVESIPMPGSRDLARGPYAAPTTDLRDAVPPPAKETLKKPTSSKTAAAKTAKKPATKTTAAKPTASAKVKPVASVKAKAVKPGTKKPKKPAPTAA